jgi:hypothetical protein
MTEDEIIELMARAMQAHEWSSSDSAPPPFKADEQNYWMMSAKKAHAALTAKGLAIVPVEPTEAQRNHVHNLVSIFVADDDHLRDVTEDLIIRSYRAMVREMITVEG